MWSSGRAVCEWRKCGAREVGKSGGYVYPAYVDINGGRKGFKLVCMYSWLDGVILLVSLEFGARGLEPWRLEFEARNGGSFVVSIHIVT